MYRVFFILSSGLALAACTSGGMSLDALKPAPVTDSVRFESKPQGAEVKISDTQSCRTPCVLNLPVNAPIVVAFSLPGYLTVSKALEPKVGTTPVELEPNPLSVDLVADPASKKKKVAIRGPRPRKPPAGPTAPPPVGR